jgi:hypothetical protein
MAGRCEENGRWGNAKKDGGRKTVYRKKERKAPFEMDGRCTSRSERNENTTVDGEGSGKAAVEIGCQGGQGSPRAGAPSGWMERFGSYYVPGVDSASNRNKYKKYFLVGKGGRCVRLTILTLSRGECLEIWEPQPSGTLRACPGLYWNCFTCTVNPLTPELNFWHRNLAFKF